MSYRIDIKIHSGEASKQGRPPEWRTMMTTITVAVVAAVGTNAVALLHALT